MTDTRALITVVVPVYNGSATLERLVERTLAVFTDIPADCEILLVNDGSTDASWKTIESLASAHEEVRGFNLMRNYGQHNTLLAGIRNARGSIIVTMDDDLQNPPEEIPKLLDKLNSGYDVVYGVPVAGQHGQFRDFSSWAIKAAMRFGLGYAHANRTSAFRAFHSHLRDAFADFQAKFVSIDVLLTWATAEFSWVSVAHEERSVGQSGYTLRKLLNHAINMVTSFSTLPLRVASITGFVFFVFGVLVLGYSLMVFMIHGRTVPGFTFLASIISIFSGVQLFSLGVIGEYIGRIHQRALDQPCYVILDTTSESED